MQRLWLTGLNYILFIVILVLLGSTQASLWFHIFGSFPPPYLWVSVLTYWALHRNYGHAILISYFTGIVVASMSSIPLFSAFALCAGLTTVLFFLRNRVLWLGINSFLLGNAFAALAVPLLLLLIGATLEPRFGRGFEVFQFIVSPLLTLALSMPLFHLYGWIDAITETVTRTDGEVDLI
jgi:hypothetical protein